MTENEEKLLKKGDFLVEVIHRCLYSEPTMSLKDLAFIIAEYVPDLTEFLKEYKKELKK